MDNIEGLALFWLMAMLMGGFIVLTVLGLTAVLQVWLSKRTKRWPGLVLPVLAGLRWLNEIRVQLGFGEELFPYLLAVDLLPAVVYLIIYFVCRKRLARGEKAPRNSQAPSGAPKSWRGREPWE